MKYQKSRLLFLLITTSLAVLLITACAADGAVDQPVEETLVEEQTPEPVPPTPTATVPPPPVNRSLWNIDPAINLRVSNLGGDQANPKVIGTEAGDFYVAWFSNPDGSNYDLRLQRFDGGGNPLWVPDGLVISGHPSMTWISDFALNIDKDGNVLLALQDVRDGFNNIQAYKIAPDGQFLWGSDGLPLSENEAFEAPSASSVVTDDHVTFAWVRELPTRLIVVLQKLTPEGEFVWGANGLIIQGDAKESYTQPIIAHGFQDNIIVVWGKLGEEGSQTMDLYAQKLNGNGSSIWNDGAPLLLGQSVPSYIVPSVVDDGVGGVFVAWHNTELKSFVQHINQYGYFTMEEGGSSVGDSGTNNQIDPQIQFSTEGQTLFVTWMETDPNQTVRGINANMMNVNGWLMWDTASITLVEQSTAGLAGITLRLLGYDIVVFYMQGEENPDANPLQSQVKAMLVNTAGRPFWDDQPIILSSETSVKASLDVAKILNQEAVAVWVDTRDGEKDIYMDNLPQAILFEQAHPATAFCSANGGLWEYRYNEDGIGIDLCVFPDASICEEWSFYLKECRPGELFDVELIPVEE